MTETPHTPQSHQQKRPSVKGRAVAARPAMIEHPADSFDFGEAPSAAPEKKKPSFTFLKGKAASTAPRGKSTRDARVGGTGDSRDGGSDSGSGSEGKGGRTDRSEAHPERKARPSVAAKPNVSARIPRTRVSTSADEVRGSAAKNQAALARKRRLVLRTVLVAVVASVVFAAFMVWNAYFRYDDVADIQGEWKTADGASIVVIDERSIRMPESVTYDYALDTKKKTIAFTFGEFSGGGSYAFTDERSVLTITEGEGDALAATVFKKVSDDTDAKPHMVKDDSGKKSEKKSSKSSKKDAEQSSESSQADDSE